MSLDGLYSGIGSTDACAGKSFKRDGVGVTAPVLSDGAAVYTPGVSESRGGVKTYFHQALKNTDLQSDSAGAVTATRLYDAWGNVVSSTGSWASPFGNAGRFGYQEDPDSGLKLLGHRYYDSSTGRFLTRDTHEQGRNWYSYCANKPVRAFDPDGLTWYYDQRTGDVWWDDPNTPEFDPVYKGRGFAGSSGEHRNNPSSEGIEDNGPLPKGRYRMGFGHSKTRSGRRMVGGCIWLEPDGSNDMHGRGGFLIHGGSADGDPSQGCIVLGKALRDEIEASGDTDLVVYDSEDSGWSQWGWLVSRYGVLPWRVPVQIVPKGVTTPPMIFIPLPGAGWAPVPSKDPVIVTGGF